MFDIGGGELLLIIFVILLLFGPKKIPEIARTLGKGMSHLRRAQAEFQRNINEVSGDIERTAGLESNPRPFRQRPADTRPPATTAAPTEPVEPALNAEQTPPPVLPPVIRPVDNAVARTHAQPPAPDSPAADDQQQ